MLLTYVVGGAGYALGFYYLGTDDRAAAVKVVAALSVGVVGLVSMVRHSVLHRSDAARMGWTSPSRNNFQIEVGFANSALGAAALLGVALGWSTTALSALVLAYALYFAQATVFLVVAGDDPVKERLHHLLGLGSQALLLGWFAVVGLGAVA